MDPLSVTTGILTLFGASSTAVKTFKKIRSLRNAPPLILALNNEIADLYLAIADINDYCEKLTSSRASDRGFDYAFAEVCTTTIASTQQKILETHQLLQYRILDANAGETFTINRLSFAQEYGRLSQLQSDLRHERQRLMTLLNRIGIRQNATIEVLLKDTNFINSRIQRQLLDGMNSVTSSQNRLTTDVGRILGLRSAPHTTQSSPSSQLLASTGAIHQSLSIPVLHTNRHGPYAQCSCRRIPSQEVCLGRLFIGYSVSPVLKKHQAACHYQSRTSLVVIYLFPVWLLYYALSLCIYYSRLGKITMSLTVRQVLPEAHIIWILQG